MKSEKPQEEYVVDLEVRLTHMGKGSGCLKPVEENKQLLQNLIMLEK